MNNQLNHIFDDTLGWIKMSVVMQASREEKYLAITNFLPDSSFLFELISGNGQIPSQSDYLLDDVSVEHSFFQIWVRMRVYT